MQGMKLCLTFLGPISTAVHKQGVYRGGSAKICQPAQLSYMQYKPLKQIPSILFQMEEEQFEFSCLNYELKLRILKAYAVSGNLRKGPLGI